MPARRVSWRTRSRRQRWHRERSERGEDVHDWEAFRQHVIALGAPDPGQDTPDDFGQAMAA